MENKSVDQKKGPESTPLALAARDETGQDLISATKISPATVYRCIKRFREGLGAEEPHKLVDPLKLDVNDRRRKPNWHSGIP